MDLDVTPDIKNAALLGFVSAVATCQADPELSLRFVSGFDHLELTIATRVAEDAGFVRRNRDGVLIVTTAGIGWAGRQLAATSAILAMQSAKIVEAE